MRLSGLRGLCNEFMSALKVLQWVYIGSEGFAKSLSCSEVCAMSYWCSDGYAMSLSVFWGLCN